MRKMTAILIPLWFFVATCAFGQRRGEPRYAEANFDYSRDPTRVILHIVEGRQDLKIQSMTIYGDGRLDLEIRPGPETILSEHSRQLSDVEMTRILRSVVDHGLAEWDNGRIHSLQLTKRGGRAYAPPPDARNITILISLREYRRGPYEMKNLERTIQVRGAEYAVEIFPDIPEFRGVLNLMSQMDEEFRRLERED
jgi:hypothetical protein